MLELVHVRRELQKPARKGYSSIHDLVSRSEKDPERKAAIMRARQELASDPLIVGTIGALRLSQGKSQSDIAKAMKSSQPHVARIEAGEDIQLSTLVKLSAALGISPAEALDLLLPRLQSKE